MSLQEIAFRAGFAEPDGLTRATRPWAGVTPTHYREMPAKRLVHRLAMRKFLTRILSPYDLCQVKAAG